MSTDRINETPVAAEFLYEEFMKPSGISARRLSGRNRGSVFKNTGYFTREKEKKQTRLYVFQSSSACRTGSSLIYRMILIYVITKWTTLKS